MTHRLVGLSELLEASAARFDARVAEMIIAAPGGSRPTEEQSMTNLFTVTDTNIGAWILDQPVQWQTWTLGDNENLVRSGVVQSFEFTRFAPPKLVVIRSGGGLPTDPSAATVLLSDAVVKAILPPGTRRDPDTGELLEFERAETESAADGLDSIREATTLDAAIHRALGAASTCWESMVGTGTFQSERARQIGLALEKWILDHERQDEPAEAPISDVRRVALDTAALTHAGSGEQDTVLATAAKYVAFLEEGTNPPPPSVQTHRVVGIINLLDGLGFEINNTERALLIYSINKAAGYRTPKDDPQG